MVSSTIQHHGEVEIAASRRLDAGKASLARARRRVHAAAVQVTLGKVRLARSEGTLTDARHDLSHSGSDTWALSIEGDSAFTAAELNLWFTSQGRQADASVPIDQLTGFYVSEGEAEGVRGDMAFAQSLVETGSFTNPDTITPQQLRRASATATRVHRAWPSRRPSSASAARCSCSSPTPRSRRPTPTRWSTRGCTARPGAARPGRS